MVRQIPCLYMEKDGFKYCLSFSEYGRYAVYARYNNPRKVLAICVVCDRKMTGSKQKLSWQMMI